MRDDRVGAGNCVLRDNGLIGVQVSVFECGFYSAHAEKGVGVAESLRNNLKFAEETSWQAVRLAQ